ncbi:MAG: exo-alpha-sialidase [Candidatus Hydrogenedentes bacterium]|nr:exo-alpha-sialidase [Candidatus Hydrogenedentota bacterium]
MRNVCLTLILALGAPAWARDTSGNIEIYRLFGPEHPGIYKHPASITELDNGDLYVAYYGGSDEYGNDTAVYGSRLQMGATAWTDPAVIADTPDHGEGNPVVWQAPDGIVWLFYNNLYGATWSNARVLVKISKDGAQTWSDSYVLNFEEGSMVRGQPIVLNNGDYLLPMYHETGEDRESTIPTTQSYFMRYNPKTKAWTETSRIESEMGNLQAQVVQMTDDYLIAYIRRGGNFLPTEDGYTLRSESRDGGQTWTPAVRTAFRNPNSAVDFIKLQSGNLLLVYNDNMNDRTPLTVTISADGDKTWPYSRNITGGDNTFAYPYAIQTKDGKIHIIFTTNERTTIMHAVFDEVAITQRPAKP